MGYFSKGKQCQDCQKWEGSSPSGRTDRGIDATGRCEACRTFQQRPCGLCGQPVTRRAELRFIGAMAAHKGHC